MSQAARRGNGPASATGKNGRKLGFPMMNPHEVYSCLSLLGINCQMDDLTRPTPASTQAIWGGLLEILCGVSQSQIDSPKNAILGTMEYRVRHYNITTRLTVLRSSITVRWESSCFSSIAVS